jgi:predicted RNA-binding protein with TRAM domain
MVTIPDSLQVLFTGTIEERGDETYIIEVPRGEVEQLSFTPGETHRVALLSSPGTADQQAMAPTNPSSNRQSNDAHPDPDSTPASGPPVSEGDVMGVEIVDEGDQGDGIAKVEGGYVIIIPEGNVGERLFIEIDAVKDTVSFGSVVSGHTQSR